MIQNGQCDTQIMEKVKELARPWFEPAIIIAVILYVMDIQIDNVRTEINGAQNSLQTEIKGVNSRIDSLERILSRQDSEIKSTDKKIDDLKNSLISRKK